MRKILSLVLGLLWAVPVWGACYDYTSATGTVVQDGTPTPDNPIEPVFYQQGNMVLRKVGDYADSYDATTGKITRNVGMKVLDGTENITKTVDSLQDADTKVFVYTYTNLGITDILDNEALMTSIPYPIFLNTHFVKKIGTGSDFKDINNGEWGANGVASSNKNRYLILGSNQHTTVEQFKDWLATQAQNGTPVVVYYPLAEPVEETIGTQWCDPIKIATTKYNETAFGPLNTALANAISVVDTVVSNTITQAGRIATLQAQKQTRPNDIADDNEKCPAGKKCLLVEDASGIPHWYEIVTGRLPDGYTELEYIESTGTQWIDTGVVKTTAGNVYRLDSKTSWADVQERQLQGCQDMFYYGPVAGYFQVAQGSNDHTTTPVVANTVYEVDVTFDAVNNTATYSVNGTQYTVDRVGPTGSYMTGVDGKNFAVFSLNEGILPFGNSKVYYYKLWKNGTLVRNLVPAKNSSGVVGMYDLANGMFYENAGEGSFIAGDPVAE